MNCLAVDLNSSSRNFICAEYGANALTSAGAQKSRESVDLSLMNGEIKRLWKN